MASREDIRYQIIGSSSALKKVLMRAERAGACPLNVSVFIAGERGVGKELIARYIHNLSAPEGPYIAVNCAAISPGLIESELFGHEVGAFTGAVKKRIGALEKASGGTLVLDEIHMLPLNLQSKLLRVLQEQEFQKVGSGRIQRLNARIIAVTNRNIETMCSVGTFQQDLYDRLNVYSIKVPGLKERPEDILPLVRHFLRRIAPDKHLSAAAEDFLQTHICPGNIRVLQNLVTASAVDAWNCELVDLRHIRQNLEGKLPGYTEDAPTAYEEIKAPEAEAVSTSKLPGESMPECFAEKPTEPVSKSIRKEVIVSVLEKCSPCSIAELSRAVCASETATRQYLQELLDAGAVKRIELGGLEHYTPVGQRASFNKAGLNQSFAPAKTGEQSMQLGRVYEFPNSRTLTKLEPPTPTTRRQENRMRLLKSIEKDILNFTVEPKSVREIMARTGRTNRSKLRALFIRPLIESGLLAMTLPDSPTSSMQKYVTTQKGQKLREEAAESNSARGADSDGTLRHLDDPSRAEFSPTWDNCRLLFYCRNRNRSADEITEHLDMSDVSAFLRLNIRPLLRVGVLETVKKDLPYADRAQRFRTSEKGQRCLWKAENIWEVIRFYMVMSGDDG